VRLIRNAVDQSGLAMRTFTGGIVYDKAEHTVQKNKFDDWSVINIKHDTASSGNTDLLIGVGYFINLIINTGRKFLLFILIGNPCCNKIDQSGLAMRTFTGGIVYDKAEHTVQKNKFDDWSDFKQQQALGGWMAMAQVGKTPT
jgi:hypothetical protein